MLRSFTSNNGTVNGWLASIRKEPFPSLDMCGSKLTPVVARTPSRLSREKCFNSTGEAGAGCELVHALTPPHCLPALTASSTLPAFLTAASALWSGTRFIYIQCAVAQEGAIQGSDGFVAIFRACHLHEAEPARLVGIPIPDDGHSVHPSVMRKQLADGLFTCIEVEISDENVLHGNRPPHLSSPEQRSP